MERMKTVWLVVEANWFKLYWAIKNHTRYQFKGQPEGA